MKRINSILLCAIIISIFSCNKDNNPPPTPPIIEKDSLLGDWQKINTGIDKILDVSFLNSREGFLIGPDAVYASKDSGKTWTTTTCKGSFANLFFLDSKMGYAQGQSDFAYTTDGGTNWTKKSIGIPENELISNCVFVSASTGFLSTRSGVYKTTDTGTTWIKKVQHGSGGIFFKDKLNGWIESNSIYKTSDGGESWQEISDAFTTSEGSLNTLQFIDDQHGWITSFWFVGRTNDGGHTWIKSEFPVQSAYHSLHFFTSEIGFVSSDEGIFNTTDGGLSWKRACYVQGAKLVEIFFLDEHTGWACGSDGTFLRLKD
jgi:photosystem II stability/assembly factor-like uncharacterized protein